MIPLKEFADCINISKGPLEQKIEFMRSNHVLETLDLKIETLKQEVEKMRQETHATLWLKDIEEIEKNIKKDLPWQQKEKK